MYLYSLLIVFNTDAWGGCSSEDGYPKVNYVVIEETEQSALGDARSSSLLKHCTTGSQVIPVRNEQGTMPEIFSSRIDGNTLPKKYVKEQVCSA